jgi:hypothetical protein
MTNETTDQHNTESPVQRREPSYLTAQQAATTLAGMPNHGID